jgi:hypothetical protein
VPIDVTGFGAANLPLAIEVTGANPQTATATTDGAGHYDFTYTPTSLGTDQVLVAADGNGNGDAEAGEASDTAVVSIVPPNQPPTANAGPDQNVNEGDLVTLDGSASSDPDGDPLTYSWAQASGAPVTLSSPTAKKPAFTPGDNGVYRFSLTVNDGSVSSAADEVVITAANRPPAVGPISAPSAPVPMGTSVSASAPFSDPGFLDPHTGSWNWDDGTFSLASITESNGSGNASGSHVYTTPGVYTVTLTITDDDAGSGAATFQYVVVYDPTAGFVTGNGWINSPAGAYVPGPALTGRANFGFVSKYKKGQTVPTGETEFQFQLANLGFHSDVYEWLVIAGAKAQYKGTGTINGAGSYGFLLTAIDGQISGGGGIDKFRMKIWDKTTGAIVYDSQLGAADGADPTTVLSGGSIFIHKS